MTCRLVAEISANHLGDRGRAHRLVEAAHEAGAHAVKFQTWAKDKMVLDRAYVLTEGPWKGRNLTQLYDEAHTPWEWHKGLFEHARDLGLEPFSSVFDLESLELLEHLGCHRYKVASFEIGDLRLIRAIARTGKPIVLSTGMATTRHIQDAIEAVWAENRAARITLLKCTSAYPADASQANLATMRDMRECYQGTEVGLSDHTLGIGVALVAIGLGASMVEKHLTLARSLGGPDAAFSLEPHELAALAREAPKAAAALGTVAYGPSPQEQPQVALQRSLYVAAPVRQGEPITYQNVRAARPGAGMSPRFLDHLVMRGDTFTADASPGTPLTEAMLRRRTGAMFHVEHSGPTQ